MSTTLIHHIKQLVQIHHEIPSVVKGTAMKFLPQLENAWLLVEEDRIRDFGPMSSCPERADVSIDAKGGMVFPSWCDSHTHLVFAASREGEFVDKINGLSYAEIAAKGGGILHSARRLRDMPEQTLFESALGRLKEVAHYGTGAIEIKSGYGLSMEGELKMLRVIRQLKENSPLTIKATFLGAHALPMEYRENREGYIKLILEEILPVIAGEGLADYIDAFCEKGFFSPEETSKIIEAGAKYGLKAKIHTNQFNSMGGIEASVNGGALSVDHLEVINEEEIACLAGSNTLPVLLPSAPFFLNDPFPPARKLIEAGLPVVLATDYNPGSSPSGKMPFVLSLACIKMKMLPEEAINAATINGAYAMELEAEHGSIRRGHFANFFITKPMPSVAYLPYAFGSDVVDRAFVRGKEV